jgi:hypothetical protein
VSQWRWCGSFNEEDDDDDSSHVGRRSTAMELNVRRAFFCESLLGRTKDVPAMLFMLVPLLLVLVALWNRRRDAIWLAVAVDLFIVGLILCVNVVSEGKEEAEGSSKDRMEKGSVGVRFFSAGGCAVEWL